MVPNPQSVLTPLIAVVAVAVLIVASSQWTLIPACLLFVAAWKVLTRNEQVPAAALAFTHQWMQVMIAVIYLAITGRTISWMNWAHWEPMVLLALASIMVLFLGYWVASPSRRVSTAVASAGAPRLTMTQLGVSYSVAVVLSFAIRTFAWSFPGITQLLLALTLARYALLFMLVRRLLAPRPRWRLVAAVLGLEVLLGFTGYFANFREPLAYVGLAVLSTSRNRRRTIVALSLIGALAVGTAIVWTAIKPAVRAKYSTSVSITDRLGVAARAIKPALGERSGGVTIQVDYLVSRLWGIYYPARALERVPSIVPFEKGKLLWGAIKNVINPRLFFPEKGMIGSDSDKVRKYTGIWVSGREKGTSIAFGYAAESYVDFGIPLMFLPIFFYGCLAGLADRVFGRIFRSEEVLQGVRVTFLWTALYLFESSWTILLGISIGSGLMLAAAAVGYESAMGLRGSRYSIVRRLPLGLTAPQRS